MPEIFNGLYMTYIKEDIEEGYLYTIFHLMAGDYDFDGDDDDERRRRLSTFSYKIEVEDKKRQVIKRICKRVVRSL